MKTFRVVLILCTIILLAGSLPEKPLPHQPTVARVVQSATGSPLTAPDTATQQQVRATYARLPLSFEANQGQADSEVKFLSRGNGYQLKLKVMEAELELRNADCGMRNESDRVSTSRRTRFVIEAIRSGRCACTVTGRSPECDAAG